MDIKHELDFLTTSWTVFLDKLELKDLSDKQRMQLVVNFTSFVTNSFQQKVLTASMKMWPEQLENFKDTPKKSSLLYADRKIKI